jgi:hypothetical protein
VAGCCQRAESTIWSLGNGHRKRDYRHRFKRQQSGLRYSDDRLAAIILVALWLANDLRVPPAGNMIDVDVPAITVTPDGE